MQAGNVQRVEHCLRGDKTGARPFLWLNGPTKRERSEKNRGEKPLSFNRRQPQPRRGRRVVEGSSQSPDKWLPALSLRSPFAPPQFSRFSMPGFIRFEKSTCRPFDHGTESGRSFPVRTMNYLLSRSLLSFSLARVGLTGRGICSGR